MAVLPNKFVPGRGSLESRVKALEDYIKYLEERLEYYASTQNKKTEGNDVSK
jgi:hypothetical protein